MIQGRLWPRDEAERRRALDAGHDLDRVLTTTDLVTGENIFFCATGITDGELMEGVRYTPAGPTTHSIVMRSKSGTIREVRSEHRLAKLLHVRQRRLQQRRRRLTLAECPREPPCLAMESLTSGRREQQHGRAGTRHRPRARDGHAWPSDLAGDPSRVDVLTRYDRWAADLWDGLDAVYDAAAVLPAVVDVIADVHVGPTRRAAPARPRAHPAAGLVPVRRRDRLRRVRRPVRRRPAGHPDAASTT